MPLPSTLWSLVRQAGKAGPEARAALDTLISTYWKPVYYYVRRRGKNADEAADLTQGFFATLLERKAFGTLDPARGRFRSFLFTALRNFLASEYERATAKRRGGGAPVLPLDEMGGDVPAADDPDQAFDRDFAEAMRTAALKRLCEELSKGRFAKAFDRLLPWLEPSEGDYFKLAEALGITPVHAKVVVHRTRRRYGDLLRDEALKTVSDPEEAIEELRALIARKA